MRIGGLVAIAGGLGVSAVAPGTAAGPAPALLAVAAAGLAAGAHGGAVRIAAVACCGLALGTAAGRARIEAIDGGAAGGRPGSWVSVEGHVLAVPRRSNGRVRVALATPGGRLLLDAPEPVPDLAIGQGARARGFLSRPQPWYRDTLRRQGIRLVLRTGRIEPTGSRRGGIAGRFDAVRDRAAAALGQGVPSREASLARGFVLGQDDRIDPKTVDDFRRSGLAHLLAVSGQNVLLLALLANLVLAALGMPLRARLLWLLGLIAVYVPLAGAGASIQRAGVMGAAAVLALLAGRPASRGYALAGSAAVTLAINPRFVSDPGWQLSFAAVAGIFLLAAPLREMVLAGGAAGPLRRGLAEGVATTVAASLATAPLIAHHFGSIPVGSLAANLVALPAVAPSMWLGMAAAGLGQIPGLPVEPLNWLNSLLLAFIAQVAAWFAAPDWALAEVPLASPWAVLGAYALLTAAAAAGLRLLATRRLRRGPQRTAAPKPDRDRLRPLAVGGSIAVVLLLALAVRPGGTAPAPAGLQIDFFDVGQGDAALIQPPGGAAVLVDGGPSGEGLEEMVRGAGATSLGTAILTHDQSDHAGGIAELLGEMPIRRLAFAVPPRSLIGEAEAAGAAPLRLAAGDRLRVGGLRLDVLWPPEPGGAAGGDPNARSLVLLARWRRFAMLLTGDAEAELAPIDPGPVDLLKVAHHGSEDAGLAGLLARVDPRLAVVSVGADNPFGHPAAATLRQLAASGAEVLRTDRDGQVELEIRRSGIAVETAR